MQYSFFYGFYYLEWPKFSDIVWRKANRSLKRKDGG